MADRVEWVDLLRGEAVLLVIGFHATGLLRYVEVDTPKAAIVANDLSEPYWMPTLSFLAGFLAENGLDEPRVPFYGGKARTVLYPFVIWTGVHALAFRVPATPSSALRLATGGTYLFFLPFLFGFHTTARESRDVEPAALAVGSLALAAGLPRLFPDVPDRFVRGFWYLLAIFQLGRSAAHHPSAWETVKDDPKWRAISAAAAAVGSLATARGNRISYRPEWAWAPALAMPALAAAANASPARRPLGFVGRNSVVYYATHYPVAYGTLRLAQARGVRDGKVALAAAIASSVAVPTALSLMRRRSRLIARLFTP